MTNVNVNALEHASRHNFSIYTLDEELGWDIRHDFSL